MPSKSFLKKKPARKRNLRAAKDSFLFYFIIGLFVSTLSWLLVRTSSTDGSGWDVFWLAHGL
jgi:hypothetical protein